MTGTTALADFAARAAAPEIRRAAAHIVVSTRANAKRCASGRDSGELTPVFRNVLVHSCYLAGAHDKWDAARRVCAARICAVAAVMSPSWTLIDQAAAFAHGIETPTDLFDIHVASSGSFRLRRESLPAIRIPDGTPAAGLVPPAALTRHRMDLGDGSSIPGDTAGSSTRDRAPARGDPVGIRLPDLPTTAALCAGHLPTREASVVVSGILRSMSSFSRFHDSVHASREREERARAEVARHLTDLPTHRGVRRARAVLTCADAACESVPERVLLWILHAAGLSGIRTQSHHRVHGRDYYVDVELVPWGVAVESDSRGKHSTGGADTTDVHRSYERQARRQKDLESIGLTFVRFLPSEYDDPDLVVGEVARRCRVPPPRPVPFLTR